jgi:hypothetical protein
VCWLERRAEIQDRIAYLTRQAEELIAEKRRRIEEHLWAVLEADIGDFFETRETAKVDTEGNIETDEAGKMLTVKKQRPRLLSDLSPDLRKAIEHVQVDAGQRQLYVPWRAQGQFADAWSWTDAPYAQRFCASSRSYRL